MKSAYSILVIGPSNMAFSDAGEDATVPAMAQAALEKALPDATWKVRPSLIFTGESMLRRVRAAVAAEQPDVVVMRVNSYAITHEDVLWGIRDRFPRLYPIARALDRQFERLAGGPRDDADTPRPWIYGPPRWLASRLFGGATALTPDQSIERVIETLDYVLALEDVFVYFWPSTEAAQHKEYDDPRHTENAARFWKTVMSHVEGRHVPCFSNQELRRGFGVERTQASDGIHSALEYRRFQARYLVQKVLAALELESRTAESAATPEPAQAP